MSIATQRLYLNGSGAVVLHGDPSAETLLCAEGQEIPAGYSEPATKSAAAPANKAVKAPANK